MGHPDSKRLVFIFLYHWRGCWTGGYQAISSRRVSTLTFDFQALPSANVIFTGIGVLLSVGVLYGSLVPPVLTRMALRRLEVPALAETS